MIVRRKFIKRIFVGLGFLFSNNINGQIIQLIDSNIKKGTNYEEVTTWYDGTPMTDYKVDNYIYTKKGNKYYKNISVSDAVRGSLFPDFKTCISVISSIPVINTIIIDKDFNLKKQSIDLPNNITLDFHGGKLRNGELKLNSTRVLPMFVDITVYIQCKIIGNYSIGQVLLNKRTTDIEWWDGYLWRTIPRRSYIEQDDYGRTSVTELAYSYIRNATKFVYGFKHGAFRKDVKRVNGKWEINCSTFSGLISLGIPYATSKYGGGSNTPNGDGYYTKELIDFLSSGDSPETFIYSHQLAYRLLEMGLCYIPNGDMSNVDTGDIIFYNLDRNNDTNDGFLGIDHSGIFSHKIDDTTFLTFEVQNTVPITARYDLNKINDIIMCARLPRKHSVMSIKNLLPNTHRKITNDVSIHNLRTLDSYLTTLKPYTQYTLVANIVFEDENCYPGLRTINNENIISLYGIQKKPDDNIYVIPFIVYEPTQYLNLDVRAKTADANLSATCNWAVLYKGLILTPPE